MATFCSTVSSSSTSKWHSTTTHGSSSISVGQGYRSRPSIPLSEISTNVKRSFSKKCIYVKEVISVNNSCGQLRLSSSELGSGSECESGDLSSDEFPSQIKIKSSSTFQSQDSTHEMGSLAQFLNHSLSNRTDISVISEKQESDVVRHLVPDENLRPSSSSSTPRLQKNFKARRLSEHLSTTIQRQKTRHERRHHTYAQLKDLAQRRLNIVAELVNLDEQYEATLAKLLLPGNN